MVYSFSFVYESSDFSSSFSLLRKWATLKHSNVSIQRINIVQKRVLAEQSSIRLRKSHLSTSCPSSREQEIAIRDAVFG